MCCLLQGVHCLSVLQMQLPSYPVLSAASGARRRVLPQQQRTCHAPGNLGSWWRGPPSAVSKSRPPSAARASSIAGTTRTCAAWARMSAPSQTEGTVRAYSATSSSPRSASRPVPKRGAAASSWTVELTKQGESRRRGCQTPAAAWAGGAALPAPLAGPAPGAPAAAAAPAPRLCGATGAAASRQSAWARGQPGEQAAPRRSPMPAPGFDNPGVDFHCFLNSTVQAASGRARLRHRPGGTARGAGVCAAGAGLRHLVPAVAPYKAAQYGPSTFGMHDDACKHVSDFLGTHKHTQGLCDALNCIAPLLACVLTRTAIHWTCEQAGGCGAQGARGAKHAARCAGAGPRARRTARPAAPGDRGALSVRAYRAAVASAGWNKYGIAAPLRTDLHPQAPVQQLLHCRAASLTRSGAHSLVSSGVLGAQRWRGRSGGGAGSSGRT